MRKHAPVILSLVGLNILFGIFLLAGYYTCQSLWYEQVIETEKIGSQSVLLRVNNLIKEKRQLLERTEISSTLKINANTINFFYAENIYYLSLEQLYSKSHPDYIPLSNVLLNEINHTQSRNFIVGPITNPFKNSNTQVMVLGKKKQDTSRKQSGVLLSFIPLSSFDSILKMGYQTFSSKALKHRSLSLMNENGRVISNYDPFSISVKQISGQILAVPKDTHFLEQQLAGWNDYETYSVNGEKILGQIRMQGIPIPEVNAKTWALFTEVYCNELLNSWHKFALSVGMFLLVLWSMINIVVIYLYVLKQSILQKKQSDISRIHEENDKNININNLCFYILKVTETELIIENVSLAFQLLTGFQERELIGKTHLFFLKEEASKPSIPKLLALKKPNGETIYLCHYLEPHHNIKDKMICYFFDITEIILSQSLETEKLLEVVKSRTREAISSEIRLRATFDSSFDGTLLINHQLIILDANYPIKTIFGYDLMSLIGEEAKMLLPNILEMLDESLVDEDAEKINLIENIGVHQSGEKIHIETTAKNVVFDEISGFVINVRDVTKRKSFEKELTLALEEKKELMLGQKLASNAAKISNWRLNIETREVTFDESLTQLLGLNESTKSLSMEDLSLIVNTEDREEFINSLQMIINFRQVVNMDFKFLHQKTREVVWLKIAAGIMENDEKFKVMVYGIAMDITHEKEIKLQLEKETKQAKIANESKSRFLAAMSHEIRTPMNGVIGMIDLLKETVLDSDQLRMAEIIRDSAFALLEIIGDILDFSKIEAGKMSLSYADCELHEILGKSIETLWINAKNKGVTLYLSPDLSLPTLISQDPVRLRQIILNLVGNAIKFSRAEVNSYVYIETKFICENSEDPWIEIHIADNGIGMTEEQVSKLFQPFTQADDSTTRLYGGTGLGLTISKSFVEMMGGRISVESESNVGTKFSLYLPLRIMGEQSILNIKIPAVSVNLHILDTNLLQVVARQLESLKIPYAEENGENTVNEEKRYILISDDHAYLETVCHSKKETQNRNYLYLSDDVMQSSVRENTHLYRLAAHPLKANDLILVIENICNAHLMSIDNNQHNESSKVSLSIPLSCESELKSRYLLLVAEDQPTNREVFKRQLTRLGYQFEIVEDGALAFSAWETGKFDLILTDCHMPNLDGFGLTQKVREAEHLGKVFGRVPIIAVTANALGGEADNCLAQGMDDYLAKPIEIEVLDKKILYWLQKLNILLVETSESLNLAATDVDEPIDKSSFFELFGSDDESLIHEMLAFFWESLQKDLIKLREAYDNQNRVLLKEVAHAAKGASLSSGAKILGSYFLSIEQEAESEDWSVLLDLKNNVTMEVERLRNYLLKEKLINE